MSSFRPWTFRVSLPSPASPDEVVCVSGSVPELGRWSPDGVVRMDRVEEGGQEGETWSCRVQLPLGVDVSFRYCVCLFVPPSASEEVKKVVVRRWESGLKPRKIRCHGKNGIGRYTSTIVCILRT